MTKKTIVRLQRGQRTTIAIRMADRDRFQSLASHRYDWQFFAHLLDFYAQHKHLDDSVA